VVFNQPVERRGFGVAREIDAVDSFCQHTLVS
jgi:hypothetical protein